MDANVHTSRDERACAGQPRAESWIPIPGWDGLYEVSTQGNVRSVHFRNQHGTFHHAPRVLRGRSNRDGYRIVLLTRAGKSRPVRVHRLVLLAFVGPAPTGTVAGHLNGVRSDNRLENLRWVSHQENSNHQLLHGTRYEGERHHRCKLSACDVVNIRGRVAGGEKRRALSVEYGVSYSTIVAIVARRIWSRL